MKKGERIKRFLFMNFGASSKQFALFVAIAIFFALGATSAHAETKTLDWERLDVDINVLSNGDLRITETNVIHFTSGTFRFGYRDIKQSRLTGIDGVSVTEENGAPMQIETVTTETGDYRVKYFFNTPARNERRTFKLSYTVSGATRYYNGGDQVYWVAIFANRNGFPVMNSTVTVRLPANSDADKVQGYGARYDVQGGGERTVVFTTKEPIDSGAEFEVRVQFPHGVISGQAPPWQQAFDAQREYDETVKPRNNLTALVGSLLMLLGGPALALVLWVTRGRDPNVGLVAEYLDTPPDIPPGVAGTLIDENAEMRDVVATLADLGKRGVIVMEEKNVDRWGADDWIIKRGPNFVGAPLRPFEQRIVQGLNLDNDGRTLSSLKAKFYANLNGVMSGLYKELVDLGFYANNPPRVRQSFSGLAIGMFVLAVVGGCAAVTALSQFTDFAICIPIGLGATALAFLIIARHMPVRTRPGADMRMRVEAFKRYLQSIEKYVDLKEAKDQFEKYLPWAIAFGLEKSWIRKFAAVDAPAPDWYYPYPRHYYPHDSYGSRGSIGGGGSTVESPRRGDVSDAASRGGGLSDLEKGAAMGMAGLERNLGSMFDSVGNTFQSTPAPVVSSGRSRSGGGGGGWSGGGGGGGGGSGGGGGGFG
jgi:uncharacterized membrane protein